MVRLSRHHLGSQIWMYLSWVVLQQALGVGGTSCLGGNANFAQTTFPPIWACTEANISLIWICRKCLQEADDQTLMTRKTYTIHAQVGLLSISSSLWRVHLYISNSSRHEKSTIDVNCVCASLTVWPIASPSCTTSPKMPEQERKYLQGGQC